MQIQTQYIGIKNRSMRPILDCVQPSAFSLQFMTDFSMSCPYSYMSQYIQTINYMSQYMQTIHYMSQYMQTAH
jgi:hypothetical protein